MATHEYHRAVEFYESAIREVARSMSTGADEGKHGGSGGGGGGSIDLVNLSHDLAKLYIKLGTASIKLSYGN